MDSESNSSIGLDEIENIVKNEPIYFVLSQFLESQPSGKNIATILEELVEELKKLNAKSTAASS